MARNKVGPEKNYQKKQNWKGKSDPFFVSNKKESQSFFVSKQEKNEMLDRKKQNDKTQGFFKKSGIDKFKSGKIDKSKDKKPFDKKKWRLQKYSKKYKLEQWEEKRKKAVLREYYREIKDEPKMNVQKIYQQYDSDNEEKEESKPPETKSKSPETTPQQRKNYVQHPDFIWTEDNSDEEDPEQGESSKPKNKKPFKQKPKNIAYKKAQSEFERIKEEKQAKREEFLKKKEEKEKALQEYKKKKTEKFKKLNKKTKKGQPIMKDRIEMLLEKIQSG